MVSLEVQRKLERHVRGWEGRGPSGVPKLQLQFSEHAFLLVNCVGFQTMWGPGSEVPNVGPAQQGLEAAGALTAEVPPKSHPATLLMCRETLGTGFLSLEVMFAFERI